MTDLKDLSGKHILDAVDFDSESFKGWDDEMEDCSVCRFRLNGTVYMAIEDPNDGYRSSMKDLKVVAGCGMTNVFPEVEVVGVYREKPGWSGNENDIL